MFELHVSDNDVTGGSIGVTWCVDKEVINELANSGVKDPQVVLVVAPVMEDNYSNKKEYRKIVPLSDLMTYVEFRVPGKNKVFAFISEHSAKETKKDLLAKSGGGFDSDVLNYEGSWLREYLIGKRSNPLFKAEPVELYVPHACFAPEPADWEKAWVNHFFTAKVVDQCHFRKRRLFAYTLQVLIVLFFILLKALLLVPALLIGSRNLTMKYVLHPLSYTMHESIDVLKGGSYFITQDAEGEDFFAPYNKITFKACIDKFWKTPFMPAIWLPWALLFYFNAAFAGLLVVVGAAAIILAIAVIASGLAKKQLIAIGRFVEELFTREDMWYMDPEEMEMLVCDGNTPKDFKSLPSKKKTFKLRFSNLKSKVCRPFSA